MNQNNIQHSRQPSNQGLSPPIINPSQPGHAVSHSTSQLPSPSAPSASTHGRSQSFSQGSQHRHSSIGVLPPTQAHQASESRAFGSTTKGNGKELKLMIQNTYTILGQSKQNGATIAKAPSKVIKSFALLMNYPHKSNPHMIGLFLALFQSFYFSDKMMKILLEYWDKMNGGDKVDGSTSSFKPIFTSDQKQNLLDAIIKQIHYGEMGVRAYGLRFLLRFLSLLDRSDSIRSDITKKLIEQVLKNVKEYGLSSGDAKGKFKILNAVKNKMKEKTLDERVDVVMACMDIVTALPSEVDDTIKDFIPKIMRRRESQLAREAARALVAITPVDSNYLTSLAGIIPEFEKVSKKEGGEYIYILPKKQKREKKEELYPCVNLEEVESRKLFVKLALTVLPTLPKEWTHEKGYELKNFTNPNLQKWLSSFYCMFRDPDHTVFLDALSITPRKNWAVFLEKDPIENGSILLKFTVERLNSVFRNETDYEVLLGTLKVAHIFISGYVIFQYHFAKQITPEAVLLMESLFSNLESLHTSPESRIRMRAYKCSLWHTNNVCRIVDQLKMEIQGNKSWSSAKLFELANSLQLHSFIHHDVFNALDDYCRFLCVQYSARVDASLLIEICKKQIREERIHNFGSRVLAMIFFIMDNCLDGSKFGQNILLTLIEFLGDYAIPISNIKSDKKVVNESLKRELMNISIKEKFFRPEMYDIQNPAMKAIVARLMKCATYNNTLVRISAVNALARVGLLSVDAIRLSVYQCLTFLEQNPVYGVSLESRNTLSLMDQIYELQQQYYNLATMQSPSQSHFDAFQSANDSIVEKVRFFCTVPADWSPLGVEIPRNSVSCS